MNNKKGVMAVWLISLGVLMVLGAVAIIQTFSKGLIVTGMNDRISWGIWEAVYIFCTGLSAGSFVISSLSLFGITQYKPIARVALIQAVVLLAIAPIFLVIALGRPERFLYVYTNFNPTSVISWGAWLLLIYPVICVLYGWFLMKKDILKQPFSEAEEKKAARNAKIFGILGVPAAILVHGYTGVLLGFIKARPLWHTPMMPVLFLTSAIVSGIALLIIIMAILSKTTSFKVEKTTIFSLSRLLIFLIVVDLFFFTCEILVGSYAKEPGHHEPLTLLISGSYAWLFLGVEIFIGAVVPIIILALHPKTGEKIGSIVFASVLIVLGIMAMRYNMVIVGQIFQPYGGPVGSYVPTWNEWSVIVGVLAFGALLYTMAVKYLPLQVKKS